MLDDTDLEARLLQIDALPLSWEGRTLARLAARLNACEELPWWMPAEEAERLGRAVIAACHESRVPVARVRRLVDPCAAEWTTGGLGVMRPRD